MPRIFILMVVLVAAALAEIANPIQAQDHEFYADIARIEHTRFKTEEGLTVFRKQMDDLGRKWLPSGVSPEDIKDPKLRHEYEEALEANHRKAERMNKWASHVGLVKSKDFFVKMAVSFFVQAYSKGPSNVSVRRSTSLTGVDYTC